MTTSSTQAVMVGEPYNPDTPNEMWDTNVTMFDHLKDIYYAAVEAGTDSTKAFNDWKRLGSNLGRLKDVQEIYKKRCGPFECARELLYQAIDNNNIDELIIAHKKWVLAAENEDRLDEVPPLTDFIKNRAQVI